MSKTTEQDQAWAFSKLAQAHDEVSKQRDELLAALRRTLSWLSSYPGNGAMEVYEQARTAIAKVEGTEDDYEQHKYN